MVEDNDIDMINTNIVEVINASGLFDDFTGNNPNAINNTMVLEIRDKKTGYDGFCVRNGEAEMVKNVSNPTVCFTVVSKSWYYTMIEDIIKGVDIRKLIMAATISRRPRILVNPPLDKCGMYHLEVLVQLFETWQNYINGGK